MKNSKTRIFLVDDHPIVRCGLQLLLGLEWDLTVCGEADSVRTALAKIQTIKPDLVVVDLMLKCSSGLELIKLLRSQRPELRLLVFSMRDEGFYAERAMRAGANGYVAKEEGAEIAVKAIRVIMQGHNYVSDLMAARMADSVSDRIVDQVAGGESSSQSLMDLLTDRELEVLEMIGTGLGSREIAGQLGLSIKTVESHREHIKSKLGLTGGPELVRYGLNWLRNRESAF